MTESRHPTFVEENRLRRQGFRLIAGVDEVGRGALAGPVMAAAVVMPARIKAPWVEQVKDSKLLSPGQRESLFDPICEAAIGFGVGSVDSWTISSIGIARATQIAMSQAVCQLSPPAEALLVDYFEIPDVKLPQKGVVDGDTLCFSIACASIVAKVTRDRMMSDYEVAYPGYMFGRHKGYGTAEHLECLRRLGPCAIHRRNFQPVIDSVS